MQQSTITSSELSSINRILTYYDYFNNLENVFWKGTTLSGGIYSTEVYAFMRMLVDEEFVLRNFDWPHWEEGKIISKLIEFIEIADLLTIKKLLTTYIRNDRFCSGAFGSFIKNGQILCILKRLKMIINKEVN